MESPVKKISVPIKSNSKTPKDYKNVDKKRDSL